MTSFIDSPCMLKYIKNGGSFMANHAEELRKKYIKNPPDGLTAKEIKNMSDEQLLDMDFFLNEDDDLEDDIGEEGFYIF